MIRSVQWSPLWGSDEALILALRWGGGTLHRKGNLQKKHTKTKAQKKKKTKTMVSSGNLVSEIICTIIRNQTLIQRKR